MSVNIESEKKEILRDLAELNAAANRKDVEGLLRFLTDDFVMISGKFKRTEGIKAMREYCKGALEHFSDGKQVPIRVEVSSSGDMAWLLASEIAKRETQEGINKVRSPYMVAFRKEDGKWKWVACFGGQQIRLDEEKE